MKRKPKITDVAKASVFSIATVSHVINGSRPVSAETAAKVNAAIAALGRDNGNSRLAERLYVPADCASGNLKPLRQLRRRHLDLLQ